MHGVITKPDWAMSASSAVLRVNAAVTGASSLHGGQNVVVSPACSPSGSPSCSPRTKRIGTTASHADSITAAFAKRWGTFLNPGETVFISATGTEHTNKSQKCRAYCHHACGHTFTITGTGATRIKDHMCAINKGMRYGSLFGTIWTNNRLAPSYRLWSADPRARVVADNPDSAKALLEFKEVWQSPRTTTLTKAAIRVLRYPYIAMRLEDVPEPNLSEDLGDPAHDDWGELLHPNALT